MHLKFLKFFDRLKQILLDRQSIFLKFGLSEKGIISIFFYGTTIPTMEKFEGQEKKLEIILFPPQAGLRNNTEDRWDRVARALAVCLATWSFLLYL